MYLPFRIYPHDSPTSNPDILWLGIRERWRERETLLLKISHWSVCIPSHSFLFWILLSIDCFIFHSLIVTISLILSLNICYYFHFWVYSLFLFNNISVRGTSHDTSEFIGTAYRHLCFFFIIYCIQCFQFYLLIVLICYLSCLSIYLLLE